MAEAGSASASRGGGLRRAPEVRRPGGDPSTWVGVLRSSEPKIEDRRSNIEDGWGSSFFGGEDRRWGGLTNAAFTRRGVAQQLLRT